MAAVGGRSVPIPVRRSIGRAVAPASSEDAPSAPIIGSLKAPSHLSEGIPDLNLPPQSPDGFSLAEIATAEYTQRLVGVSSAPARTFIEAARRAGVPPGTSPTVLSVLQQKAAVDEAVTGHALPRKPAGGLLGRNSDVDSLAAGLARSSLVVGSLPVGNAFAKQFVPASGAVPSHGAPGGLAAALRGPAGLHAAGGGVEAGGQAAGGSGHHGHHAAGAAGDPAPLVGSLGRRAAAGGVVLATSFRDAAHMPVPLPLTEEGDSEEEDSEDEGQRQARRRADARKEAAARGGAVEEKDEDEEEEDEASAAQRRAERETREDGGVFESDL